MEDIDARSKRTRRVKHEEVPHHQAPVPGEEAADDVPQDAGAEAEPAVVEEVKSRDIGNYKYTPWKGLDMWTNPYTRHKTFKEQEARKLRRQK